MIRLRSFIHFHIFMVVANKLEFISNFLPLTEYRALYCSPYFRHFMHSCVLCAFCTFFTLLYSPRMHKYPQFTNDISIHVYWELSACFVEYYTPLRFDTSLLKHLVFHGRLFYAPGSSSTSKQCFAWDLVGRRSSRPCHLILLICLRAGPATIRTFLLRNVAFALWPFLVIKDRSRAR